MITDYTIVFHHRSRIDNDVFANTAIGVYDAARKENGTGPYLG